MAKRSIPKRFHLKDPELAKAVAAALADCKEVKAHQRLLAVRMAASGQFTAQQIAEQLGISRRRLFDWIKMLKAGGLPGLLACDHGGGATPGSPAQFARSFRRLAGRAVETRRGGATLATPAP